MKLFSIKALVLLLLAVAALAFTGCATNEDSENASVRPWNAPQGWENGLPTTMQEGR